MAQRTVRVAVNITIDFCFSGVIYGYTDPINNIAKQTLVNSTLDGIVDVSQTIILTSDDNKSLLPESIIKNSQSTQKKIRRRPPNYVAYPI